MWACMFCIKKQQQTVCCGKIECQNSSARFGKPEHFWEHLKNTHPKEYEKLIKYEKT